jgi:uncharacterized protein YdeI (YjbR/CyaY-like superfamily)
MKCTIEKIGGYMHCIPLDNKTVARFTAGGNKRVVCTINKTITLHAAIMRTKEGMHYIMIAAKYLKQLKLKAGSIVEADIKIDESELQFNIPEEFIEVLSTDPEAEKFFNHLTDGNKRGLIALVNMVKSSDKKIERALKIAERLKMGITSPQKMMK